MFFKKEIQLALVEKLLNWNTSSKRKWTKLFGTRVLQFLTQEKEGQRNKDQVSYSFLLQESLSKAAADMNDFHCCICNLNIYSFA